MEQVTELERVKVSISIAEDGVPTITFDHNTETPATVPLSDEWKFVTNCGPISMKSGRLPRGDEGSSYILKMSPVAWQALKRTMNL